ncbi:hypothetical protein AKJ65_04435 [candidate division MSBL1 archaeon SCGC-AAA259E19]|uniref:Uncharacterized protein n=1 Tax=candidate division MSBL1 archaeon SCGC-AAA259E19 TaxID=1698264 RepID=A0A133UJR2_9EURY|nr:hypothetical protein AKJ65_04435 [candidate division MSBL1 archaeon SCGC-AAA259E19]
MFVTSNILLFDSVGGQVWDDNEEPTSDSTPKISLTISDVGLGVALEDLTVQLDNNDNFEDGTPYTGISPLENSNDYTWSVENGAIFENTIENAGVGLHDGTYACGKRAF